jgi:hypothetical protein
MLDHHKVLAILQLDGNQARALIANEKANNLWMQGKYGLFIRGLFQRVLLEFLHPMCFVDRMLIITMLEEIIMRKY